MGRISNSRAHTGRNQGANKICCKTWIIITCVLRYTETRELVQTRNHRDDQQQEKKDYGVWAAAAGGGGKGGGSWIMSAPYSSMRKDTNAQVWLWRRRRSLGLLLQCIIYGMLLVLVRADHHRDAEKLHTLQIRPMAMADMYTIVFYRGLKTTSRRTAPILQLRCLKGCEYVPGMYVCLVCSTETWSIPILNLSMV